MGETVRGARGDGAHVEQVRQVAVEGDLAQADDDADAGEGGELGVRCSGQLRISCGAGLSPGGAQRTTEAIQASRSLRPSFAMDGAGLVGEAELVEDGVHEVAGAVAGEGAAGAIGTVGSGSEAEEENAGAGVAEAGNGPRPVGLVDVGAAAGFADGGTVGAEARTALAEDDVLPDLLKLRQFRIGYHGF